MIDLEGLLFSDTPPYKILCEEESQDVFRDKLKSLQLDDQRSKNQKHLEKLWGICARLEFVEEMRRSFLLAEREFTRLSQIGEFNPSTKARGVLPSVYQFDRLAAYLTATCIDVAVGKKPLDYPQWLLKALKSKNLRSSFSSVVDSLVIIDEPEKIKTELKNFIGFSYNKEYLPEEGITRKFVKFFTDMPAWLKQWLTEVYIVEDGELPLFDRSNLKWFIFPTEQKLKRIAAHISETRNRYTHSVSYDPTFSARNPDFYKTIIKETTYLFGKFYEESSNGSYKIKKTVGLRYDLAESDVIRFLVVVQLRKWLGFSDDETYIQSYWDKINYRQQALDFLIELDDNLSLIEMWCSSPLYIASEYSKRFKKPIALLKDASTRKFFEAYSKKGPFSLFAPVDFPQYLEALGEINQKINQINTQCDIANGQDPVRLRYIFLSEISKLEQIQYLVHFIEKFRKQLKVSMPL